MGLEQYTLLFKGKHLIKIFDGYFICSQRTTELNSVKRKVHGWDFPLNIFWVRIAYSKGVLFAEIVSDIVKLVVISWGTSYNSTHFQKLVVLLVKISLLSSNLLSKKVRVDDFLEFFICFFLFFWCFYQFVKSYSIPVNLIFNRFVSEELSIQLLLRSIHFKIIYRQVYNITL